MSDNGHELTSKRLETVSPRRTQKTRKKHNELPVIASEARQSPVDSTVA